jgi:EAL and modified HD-GYP domain-containing signal transduction protein
MSGVFVARQPIFDARLDVVGYELLFRHEAVEEAVICSAEGATTAVVLNSFTEIGLERIVGEHPAWINVSRDFVLAGSADSLPADRVLLEILEDQVIDERLIAAVRKLKSGGYRLALDDYRSGPDSEPLLDLVDVVKLDLLALGREGMERELAALEGRGITVVAEKVETHEDFLWCKDAGCELFQGYFFCRPELIRERRGDANRLALLRILAALRDPHIELSDLERMLAGDLGLSYRLLRYVNSAFLGLGAQVRSIGQALALLDVGNLVRWATLSIYTSIEDKPLELTVTALIRARFCELAARRLRDSNPSELFTLGLFSLIDALMDTPIEKLLEKIPFPQDMGRALIAHQGEKGQLLEAVTALEGGDFDRAHAIVPNAAALYLEAMAWVNDTARALLAPVSVTGPA